MQLLDHLSMTPASSPRHAKHPHSIQMHLLMVELSALYPVLLVNIALCASQLQHVIVLDSRKNVHIGARHRLSRDAFISQGSSVS